MSNVASSESSRTVISINSGVLDLKTRRNVSFAPAPGCGVVAAGGVEDEPLAACARAGLAIAVAVEVNTVAPVRLELEARQSNVSRAERANRKVLFTIPAVVMCE